MRVSTGAPCSGRPCSGRHRSDRGSVMMLLPAGVLIVLLLGSIALDLAHVHLAHQSAQNTLSGVANDAVGMLAEDSYRDGDGYRLDRRAVDELVTQRLTDAQLPGTLVGPVALSTTDTTVELVARIEVPYLFASGMPGVADGAVVTVRATAVVEPAGAP